MPADIPVVFGHWEQLLRWLLARTEKFPKSVTLTFRVRIDNLALQVYNDRAFTHACEQIDIAGRMVGGWLRSMQQEAHG